MSVVKKEIVLKVNGDNRGENQILELFPKEGDNYFRPVTQQVRSLKTITGSQSLNYSSLSSDPSIKQYPPQNQAANNQYAQSTIKSISQSDVVQMRGINLAGSLGQSQNQHQHQHQKMLISKSELRSFAQCFAQQKIQLQKTVNQLTNKLSIVNQQLTLLQEQNTTLKTIKSTHQQQHSQSQIDVSPSLIEQVQKLKAKLKQQFQKRIISEKEFHNQKAVSFQLNKKIQFLTQKINYQQQQLTRCQNLLKIKQDIIQNFQWEKSIITTRNNTQHPDLYTSISKQQSKQLQNQENVSPLTKKCLMKNSKKQSNNGNYNLNKTQNHNQTLKLSEINLNASSSVQSNKKSIQKSQLAPLNGEQSVKKVNKHVISKVPEDSQNRDSKKKMNISLKKRSQNSSLNHIEVPTSKDTSQQQKQHLKPKSIVIKRHPTNQSQSMTIDESLFEAKQREIETYYMRIITQLQKQNSALKRDANQKSSLHVNTQPSALRSIKNTNISNMNVEQKHSDIEWKYSMMRQKSLLLQSQIQKTVQNYLTLQQKNTSLEKIIQSLQTQLKYYQRSGEHFDQEGSHHEQDPLNRPSIEFSDLVTPQFKDSKWKNNFFPKTKDQNHHQSLFQNISLQENCSQKKNGLLDTFEKQKPYAESCFIDNNRIANHLFIETEEKQSNNLNNQMEDVSEIICRNDEEEVLEEVY